MGNKCESRGAPSLGLLVYLRSTCIVRFLSEEKPEVARVCSCLGRPNALSSSSFKRSGVRRDQLL